jgi:hypothetical protein
LRKSFVLPPDQVIELISAVVWDGLASCLRSYTVTELRELVHDLDAKDYQFEIGSLKSSWTMKLTYLIGYPE